MPKKHPDADQANHVKAGSTSNGNGQLKAEEYYAAWQRASADLANFRKRTEEERRAFAQYAHADIMLQILPVLDNFKRASAHTPEGADETHWTNWANGIKAVEKQFEMILHHNGITEITTSVGQVFDPQLHEAIESEPSDQPTDTIMAVIDPGYMLHGKVLRPAKVKVAK